MSVLSRLGISASILDFEAKRFFRGLIGVGTIAAAGSAQTDATAITTGRVMVTEADGTKGVILPSGELDMAVEVVNTVSNQTLKVYPNTGAQINALGANNAFSLVAGASRMFFCDAALHWYTGSANLTGTATTSDTTELNRLDGALDTNLVADKAAITGVAGSLTLGGSVTAVGSFIIGAADLSEVDMEKLDGITDGTAAANKALVAGATKNLDTLSIDPAGMKSDGVVISSMKWVDVTVTAALLDGAGTANVIAGVAGDQYKIRDVRLVGGGTNFGAGGDRLIDLTDGTTVWTQIANADIETAPTVTLPWGNAKVPFLTGTSDTASASNQAIRFVYSGGTSDHTTGSIKFSVALEKVA